jgi:amino acid efflux transporter
MTEVRKPTISRRLLSRSSRKPCRSLRIAHAAGVLFFAFAGWEAASHLSAEFARPRRDLFKATTVTLVVAGMLYVGLAVTTVGVMGAGAAGSSAPLTALLEYGLGRPARGVTAFAAVLLSFDAINTYIAGGARLGAALARDGALPRWPAAGGAAGQVPRRSLVLLAALTVIVTAPTQVCGVGLGTLMRATAACLAAVTVVGTAAAVRLLPGRRIMAVTAGVFTLAVLASYGVFLLCPAALGGLAVLATRGLSPAPARGRPRERPNGSVGPRA